MDILDEDSASRPPTETPSLNLSGLGNGLVIPINTTPNLPNSPVYCALPKFFTTEDVERHEKVRVRDILRLKEFGIAETTGTLHELPVVNDEDEDEEYDEAENEELPYRSCLNNSGFYIVKELIEVDRDRNVYRKMMVMDNPAYVDRLVALREFWKEVRHFGFCLPLSLFKPGASRVADFPLRKNESGMSSAPPGLLQTVSMLQIILKLIETPKLLYGGKLEGETMVVMGDDVKKLMESLNGGSSSEGREKRARDNDGDDGNGDGESVTLGDDDTATEGTAALLDGLQMGEEGTVTPLEFVERAIAAGAEKARKQKPTRGVKKMMPKVVRVPFNMPPETHTNVTLFSPESSVITVKMPLGRHVRSGGETYSFELPRFAVDIVHVPFQRTKIRKDEFPDAEDVELMFVVVTSFCPHDDFVSGINRLIQLNKPSRVDESIRKRAKQSASTFAGKASKRSQEMVHKITEPEASNSGSGGPADEESAAGDIDPICLDASDVVKDLKMVVNLMAYCTGNGSETMNVLSNQLVNFEAHFKHGDCFDPARFFSITGNGIYSKNGIEIDTHTPLGMQRLKIRYDYEGMLKLSVTMNEEKHMTNAEFASHPQLDWPKQMLPIQIFLDKQPSWPHGGDAGTAPKMLVYHSAVRVVRLPNHCISPVHFMMMRFMHQVPLDKTLIYQGGVKCSAKLPFPALEAFRAAQLQGSIDTVLREVDVSFLVIGFNRCVADCIRYKYWQCTHTDVKDARLPRAIFSNSKIAIRRDVMKEMCRNMTHENMEIVAPARAALAKVGIKACRNRAITQFVIVNPRTDKVMREPGNISLVMFDNLSDVVSNFDTNFMADLLHNGFGTWGGHKYIQTMMIKSTLQFRMNFGMQSVTLILGETGGGKSVIMATTKTLLGAGVYQNKNSSSAMGYLTATMHTCQFQMCDDSAPNAIYMYKPGGLVIKPGNDTSRPERIGKQTLLNRQQHDQAGNWKSLVTEGSIVYTQNVQSKSGSGRVSKIVTVDGRFMQLILSNYDPETFIAECYNRIHVLVFRKLIVDLAIKPNRAKQDRCEELCSSLLQFSLYTGHLMRAGAVPYYKQLNSDILLVFYRRFKTILNRNLGFRDADMYFDNKGTLNNRIIADILFQQVEACMFHRVWVELTAGLYSKTVEDEETGNTRLEMAYGQAFDPEWICNLARVGAFMFTENDFFRGLSLMEETFQYTLLNTFLTTVIIRLETDNLYVRDPCEEWEWPDTVEGEEGDFAEVFSINETTGDIVLGDSISGRYRTDRGVNSTSYTSEFPVPYPQQLFAKRMIEKTVDVGTGKENHTLNGNANGGGVVSGVSHFFSFGNSNKNNRGNVNGNAAVAGGAPTVIPANAPLLSSDEAMGMAVADELDPNYLDVSSVFKIPDYKYRGGTSAIMQDIAMLLVKIDEPKAFTFEAYCEFLEHLMSSTYDAELVKVKKVVANKVFLETKLVRSPLPILRIVCHEKKILLCKDWLDHYRNAKFGLFRKFKESPTFPGFCSSVVEAVVSQFGYVGMRPRTIALPGCVLDRKPRMYQKQVRRDDQDPSSFSYPQIAKKISFEGQWLPSRNDKSDRFLLHNKGTKREFLKLPKVDEESGFVERRFTDMDTHNLEKHLQHMVKEGDAEMSDDEITDIIRNYSAWALQEAYEDQKSVWGDGKAHYPLSVLNGLALTRVRSLYVQQELGKLGKSSSYSVFENHSENI